MTSKKPRVLIVTYFEPEHIERIRAEVPGVEVVYRPELQPARRFHADHRTAPGREHDAVWHPLLAEADVLLDFDGNRREELPDLAPNVKWVQATSAGIGQLVKRLSYDTRTDWIFTTASGVHARPLGEFALMSMLMFAKDWPYLQQHRQAHTFERYASAELAGRTLSIIGLGRIGRETARLAKAFDMRVIGSRRDVFQAVDHVDALYKPDDLKSLLTDADYVVLATPHTPETENLIDAEALAMLPERAVLINVARGAVVDEPALIEALQAGRLRGAALDVFATEPLPPESPLWDMPNVIISPHSASTADTENAKITDIFIDNLKRWLAGEPMRNVLDTEKLY